MKNLLLTAFTTFSLIVGSGTIASGLDAVDNATTSHLGGKQHDQSSDGMEYVYLNSPYDYEGPGIVKSCKKVTTYQGGPKTGSWVTYYMCAVDTK